jgi:hypothetical protein
MGSSMPFMATNNTGAGDMSMMYQRMMNGMGTPYSAMMGGGMGGMMGGFNPMMGMGMGMGRFGMGAMGGMGGAGGVGGMTPMAAAAAAGNMGGNMGMGGAVGGMRLGMGPIGMAGAGAGMGGMGAAGMGAAAMGGGGMGMGMRQNMGMMGAGRGRPGMNQGPGPARITNRGQHGFHPYARFSGSWGCPTSTSCFLFVFTGCCSLFFSAICLRIQCFSPFFGILNWSILSLSHSTSSFHIAPSSDFKVFELAEVIIHNIL